MFSEVRERVREKMTTQTDPLAKSIKGKNPQHLMEKITRDKVYAMTYYKEKCFASSAERVVDLAVELTQVGGIYGSGRACEFLCLALKMLQIAPEREIVIEFIKNEEHKYARLLGAFYLRLVGTSQEVYRYLEPLLNDYRKVRRRTKQGGCELCTVDEFVDDLLTKDFYCDIALPRLAPRYTLEAIGALEERKSLLEDDLGEGEDFESIIEKAVDVEMLKRKAMQMPGETIDVDEANNNKRRMLDDDNIDDDDDDSKVDKEKKKKKKNKKTAAADDDEKGEPEKLDEIAEANALRAKLGLKPLK